MSHGVRSWLVEPDGWMSSNNAHSHVVSWLPYPNWEYGVLIRAPEPKEWRSKSDAKMRLVVALRGKEDLLCSRRRGLKSYYTPRFLAYLP